VDAAWARHQSGLRQLVHSGLNLRCEVVPKRRLTSQFPTAAGWRAAEAERHIKNGSTNAGSALALLYGLDRGNRQNCRKLKRAKANCDLPIAVLLVGARGFELEARAGVSEAGACCLNPEGEARRT